MGNLFTEQLNARPLIFDGGMGSELYKRGFFVNTSYENLCLSNAKTIQEIHQAYKDAGAEVLTTNSYGANQHQLTRFGLGDKVAAINEAAVMIARKVAGQALLVAGSIGPLGDVEQPEEESVAVTMLQEQMKALLSAGADFLLFETVGAVNDLERILAAVNGYDGDVTYAVSFVFQAEGMLKDGTALERVLELLSSCGKQPAAFGMNCALGPDQMLSVLEEIVKQIPYPVIVQPNAGSPKSIDGRMLAMCSPEYFTTYCMRYLSLGVRGVGGCCGITPDHIRDMARSVSPMTRIQTQQTLFAKETEAPEQEVVPFAERSTFAAKLAAGKWVLNVEVVPPQGYELDTTIEKAKQCLAAGFDAINIPDGPRASSRVSPMVTAYRIQAEAGIEAILHQCCRDKNLIGMQSDLLGCAALGINNLLFITGDPPKLGDYPFASGVFDVDSIGLIGLQNRLNHGLDLGGKAIAKVTGAVIGAGADPNAIDMAREIRRTREKIQAGAEYIVTQPVFDPDALLRFMDAVPELAETPLIAGIWPLASLRNAEFMRTQVPGVVVPDEVIQRMSQAKDKESQLQCGIDMAREAIARIRDRAAGVQVSAPFGRVSIAIEVIRD